MQARFARLAFVVVLFSAAVAGCGKYSISNIRSAKAFQDANALYLKNDWANAAVRYQDAINLNPDLGFAYFFLGHSHDQQYKSSRKGDQENTNHLVEAAKDYRIAVDKLKGATDEKEQRVRRYAFEYLIAVYGPDKLNDPAKGIEVAQELIALDPSDPGNYRILAKLYEEQGKFDESEAQHQKAIQVRPNDPMGYQMLADFYFKRGDFAKTMEAWYKRADVEPKNPEAWHTIGAYYQDMLYKDKRLPRATALEYATKGVAAEDKALELYPDYYEAVAFKNILLRAQALNEKDPAKVKALLAEADILFKRATELRDKQAGAPVDASKQGKGK